MWRIAITRIKWVGLNSSPVICVEESRLQGASRHQARSSTFAKRLGLHSVPEFMGDTASPTFFSRRPLLKLNPLFCPVRCLLQRALLRLQRLSFRQRKLSLQHLEPRIVRTTTQITSTQPGNTLVSPTKSAETGTLTNNANSSGLSS